MSEKQTVPVDPDVVAIASLIVSGLQLLLQVVGLKSSKPAPPQHNQMMMVQLRDTVEGSIRNTERLIRLLSRATDESGKPIMQSRFRFGDARAFMDNQDFQQLQHLLGQIGQSAINGGIFTMSLIQSDPALAELIGTGISTRFRNVIERINEIQSGTMIVEDALDMCLSILKTLSIVLDEIDRHGPLAAN
jgi:hypothetical protein